MARQVVFRTDASVQIGTGHVMRCLALAQALRADGAVCRFVMRDLAAHAGALVSAAGFEVTLLRPPAPTDVPDCELAHGGWLGVAQSVDAAETAKVLASTPPDWLVVDHYALDRRWQSALRGMVGRIMVIDDLADRAHDADVLLDQNLGRSGADYDGLLPADCIRLLGPRFALLRPEFAAARPAALARRAGRAAQPGHRLSILLAMGGIDKDNATGQVLAALDPSLDIKVTVVLGGQAPHLDRVRAQARALAFPVAVVVDVKDMARLMAEADLGIGAGGSTSWERCCLGLPTMLLTLADNQMPGAVALERAGAAVLLGDVRAGGWTERLRAQTAGLVNEPERRAALSACGARLVDGAGVARVSALLIAGRLSVRPALATDAEPIWRWRHAGGAERFYQSGQATPLADHLQWFDRALEDTKRMLLIVELDKRPVAHIRLDMSPDNSRSGEISICINPDFRGGRLGVPVLNRAMEFLRNYGISCFHAWAHKDNAASIRIFLNTGYYVVGHDDPFVQLSTEKERVVLEK